MPPDLEGLTPPVPWTAAYQEVRQRTLQAAVADNELIERFAAGASLPAAYGFGIDERCIEYPWLIANLPAGRGRVLDAGSSLNHAFLLDHAVVAAKRLHVVTLAPEDECFWRRGVSYLFEDLRALPITDAFYDVVISVSSLEHVGCDNTFYTKYPTSVEPRLDDYLCAAGELSRVLRPGGILLATVPFGRYQFHGAFQQFDRDRLSRLEVAFGHAASVSETFYRHTVNGWQLAPDGDCASCEYVAWVAEVMRSGRWPEEPRHEPDFAAAARAVACVRMVKR